MTKAEKLLRYLDRIRGGGLESGPSPEVHFEHAGVDLEAAARGFDRLKAGLEVPDADLGALEAIVHVQDRPVFNVIQDAFAVDPAASAWFHLEDEATQRALAPALRATGRVELPDSRLRAYGGTAFVVGPNLLMTNRHVALLFTDGLGAKGLRLLERSEVDLAREVVRRDGVMLTVERVVLVHPVWDMALLEVSGLPEDRAPVRLVAADPAELAGQQVVIVGYPAFDSRNPDAALQDRIFGRVYGVKRVQPGAIGALRTYRPSPHPRFVFPEVEAMTHDASTLGGNSGSLVVRPNGDVVGLHFGGLYLDANFSVPMAALAADRRVTEHLTFERARPPGDPHAAAWRAADPDGEEGSRPSPQPTPRPPTAAPPVASDDDDVTVTITVRVRTGPGGPEVSVAGAPSPALPPAPRPSAAPIADVTDEAAEPADRSLRVVHDAESVDPVGYRSDFLGVDVPLPDVGAWASDLPEVRGGGTVLRYQHFSVQPCASRRCALFTATNIDGARAVPMPTRWFKSTPWAYDGRLARRFQMGPELYDDNPIDRGHLTRRLDPVWGTFDEAKRANDHTFYWTNCAPQHEGFNREDTTWGGVEDYIRDNALAHALRVTVFTGPVLAADDPRYRGTFKLPRAFWKVVVMRRDTDGALSATAYLLTQADLLADLESPFVFGAWRTYQVSITTVEAHTGLGFPHLRAHDPLHTAEEGAPAALPLLSDFNLRL